MDSWEQQLPLARCSPNKKNWSARIIPPPISTLLKLTTLRKTKYHKHTWYLPFSYREKDACNQIYYPPHPPLPGTRSLKRKIRKKREKKDQKMRHSANPPYFGTLRRACSSHDCVKRYEKRKQKNKIPWKYACNIYPLEQKKISGTKDRQVRFAVGIDRIWIEMQLRSGADQWTTNQKKWRVFCSQAEIHSY